MDFRYERACKLIEKAKSGDVRAARELFDCLSEFIMDDVPIPVELKAYFLPKFWNVSKDADPLVEFNLKTGKRGRPKDRLNAGFDVINSVIKLVVEEKFSSISSAFNELFQRGFYSEDGIEPMPEITMRTLFYEYLATYKEQYGLPEELLNLQRKAAKEPG